MPYKSKAQAAFMHIHHPEIAKRWDKDYPVKKHLPEHVKKHTDKKASLGASAAIFALEKVAAEELRLKLKKKSFHGLSKHLKPKK